MRYVYLATFFVVVLTVGILGFRGSISSRPPLEVFPDMDRQPKLRPQDASTFFADGRADRPLPVGVVARGSMRADAAVYQGRAAVGDWVRGIPSAVTVDARFLQRGRERYSISCAPCHGALGDGNGITKAYGMGATPTFHDDRLRTMAEGEVYNTITNGKGTMMGYADKVVPEDRWAIVAYVRALQRAQHGSVADVPTAHKAELGIQ
ncbi:MAG: cytochrome c [Verrucomicrobia bacterium]|nr:cytochrome c [Verrucomicrobiota bacterium]